MAECRRVSEPSYVNTNITAFIVKIYVNGRTPRLYNIWHVLGSTFSHHLPMPADTTSCTATQFQNNILIHQARQSVRCNLANRARRVKKSQYGGRL